MDVRPGYKLSGIGLVPEDWCVSTVGAEFSIQLGKMLDAEKNVGVSKPFLGNRAVQWGRIDISDIGEVKLTPSDLQRFRLRDGDLLVCEGGEVGRAAIWRQPIDECYYQKALHRLRPIRGYNVRLMLDVLQRLASTGFLQNFVTQTSIAHLPKDKFETIPIPVPPTEVEQEAIAETLGDADGLIESVEQLLAKKRQIKQGAMQELLSGRKRLPGFEGNREYKQTAAGVLPTDWNAGPIGRAIEKLEAGASVNSEKVEAPEFESYPCVLKTGAANGGLFNPRESKKVASRDLWRLNVSVRKDTILISRMNTLELVGESGYVPSDYPNLFVPDRMWMATVRSTVSPRWLSHILTWRPVKSQISASATGTSGSMKNISKPSFRTVEIPYPPVEEQCAIAKVLSDFETEITNLAARLVKARQIKQGMMQELLTGRIRLV